MIKHKSYRQIASGGAKELFVVIMVTVLSTCSFTGCSLIPKEEAVLAPPPKQPEKVVYDTMIVKKDTFEKKAECMGTLVSEKQFDLNFQNRDGYLKAIYIKTGDKVRTDHNKIKPSDEKDDKEDVYVKKGDLIAELDTDDLQNEIKMQELELKKAELDMKS